MRVTARITALGAAALLLCLAPLAWVDSLLVEKVVQEKIAASALQLNVQMAEQLSAELEAKLDLAQALALGLLAQAEAGDVDREAFSQWMRRVAQDSPDLVGVWSVWEPYAFDDDGLHAGAEPYGPDGRFSLYWHRADGAIDLHLLGGFEDPAEGQYYLLPRRDLRQTLVAPTPYAIEQGTIWVASLVAPIVRDGQFLGAVGVDIGQEDLHRRLQAFSEFAQATVVLADEQGRILSHPDRAFWGKSLTALGPEDLGGMRDSLHQCVLAEQRFIQMGQEPDPKRRVLLTSVPLQVGRAGQRWSLALALPVWNVLEDFVLGRRRLLGLALALLLAFALVLFGLLAWTLRPLRRLDAFARDAAQTDEPVPLGRKLLTGQGELGELARAIVAMREALRHNLQLAELQNQRRNWIQQGQNGLFDTMKGNQGVEELARNSIAFLARHTASQMAVLYLANHDTKRFKMVGSYELAKRLSARRFVPFGEGLLGEVAQRREPLQLENLPPEFTAETLGMAQVAPRHLLMFPFSYGEQLVGIVELARLGPFGGEPLEFLASVNENLAISFNTALYKEKTELLGQMRKVQKKEMLRNIKELKDMQRENFHSESELQVLLQTIDIAASRVELDPLGRVVVANPRFSENFLGQGAPTPVGRPIQDFLHHYFEGDFEAVWRSVLQGNSHSFVWRRRPESGPDEVFQCFFSPVLKGNGKVQKVIHLINHIA